VPYIIDNRAGQAITIPDGALNQDFSIELVGRNYTNYGEPIAKSFIDLLNNFANNTAPTKQTNGQVWYDTSKKVLRIYDSVGGNWVPMTPLISASGVPSGENATSTSYYDQTNSKFYINDGTGYKVIGLAGETNTSFSGETAVSSPTRYGTRLRNIFLEDSSSVPRAVTAIVTTNSSGAAPGFTNEEQIVAIFSGHAEFTAGDITSSTEGEAVNYYTQLTATGGIGATIKPGLNLRADNDSLIKNSSRAFRSDSAYSLNTGSFGSDSSNISASAVFHNASDSIPNTDNVIDLGTSSKRFAEGHVTSLTSTNILASGTASLGASGTPFTNAYLTSVNIAGAVTFAGANNLGTTSARAGTGFFSGLDTSAFKLGTQVFPASDGASGQQLFTDGSGALFWRDPVSSITNIFARGGTVSSNTTAVVNGVSETTFAIDIGAGPGVTVLDDTIQVDISSFTSDNLPEGTSNLYYTNARAQAAISVIDSGGLGSLSESGGAITYAGPSTTDIRDQFSAGTGISISSGQISTDDSNISHDNLSGFVSNEHIDHSAVSITAGTGLTGGGTIASSRTLNVAGGYGITANANDIEVANSDIRALFTPGVGISINASGEISNTGVLSDPDTTDFVTKAGTQSIGGAKTFTTAITATGGISMGAADVAYTGTLVFTGGSGSVSFGTGGTISATGDITAFSDRRLKENIEPIDNALEKLQSINGVTFNTIGQEKRQAGLIAQDLQKVLPEAVHENEDGMLSVAYGNTVSLLVQAIKELQAEVAELRQESSSNANK
jgi:hypothetical protein